MRTKKKPVLLKNVLVEDYAAGGKSLARVEGKVIFIENSVPGDVVDVRLLKNKKDWAEGIPVHIHSLSKERTTPFCPHFGVCGGCQWQMLPYERQLYYKQREVEENLRRIGKISLPVVQPIIGAAEERYYRNKLEYTFGTREFTKDPPVKEPFSAGTNAIIQNPGIAGFHAKGFFDKIVDIKTCYLQAEPTNLIRLTVKDFVKANGWTFYNIREHTGFLRTMQVRICISGEIMVNVVFGENDPAKIKSVMDHLLSVVPSITSLLYTVNTKMNDSLQDLQPVVYHGKGYVIEEMRDDLNGQRFQFKVGPTSFFQTNTRQAEQLYRATASFAELHGHETVYDLYCGTGSIGIFCSRQAGQIIGVELIEAAIDDARENAAINNLSNTKFFAGDVSEICHDVFFKEHGRPDVIITDPPRVGMHEKLVRKILEVEAPLVVYVSCNPATQARDLNLLDEKYEVTAIQPVDMFPHTHHIENVAQLRLRNRSKTL